jgi:phenylalanyl-tRNA synthetase beta chain
MAQLQITLTDLNELVSIGEQEAIDTLTMLGFPTEKTESGELDVEVTPNRPDALCVEGIARALRCYKTGQPVAYQIGRSGIDIRVDPSVREVRPFIGGACVRGVRLTDSALRSSMQLQEKLHETLGRKRRKSAIGLYDADVLKPPFRYFACGREDVSFVPLERAESMTPLEILRRHPKGMDYAHLVGDLCPMIEDAKGDILSFPPIINGESSRVKPETGNLFIEATGTSQEAVLHAVSIVASALAERGGRVEEITIDGAPYKILQERAWMLPVKESERLLGMPFTHEQVASLLLKMGYRVEGEHAYSAGYRADIMNEVDLIEDVAIAYGFNNFEPRLPSVATVGGQAAESPYHQLLVGLGFDEAVTWTLSNAEMEKKAGIPHGQRAEIENPLTADFTQLRASILPNLLAALADSKDEKLPIKLYEIGPVADTALRQSLCIASMHAKASFAEIKGTVLSLAESTGKSAEVREAGYGTFMKGRCAKLFIDGVEAGFFGEVAPEVLAAFGLEQPVCAAEIAL